MGRKVWWLRGLELLVLLILHHALLVNCDVGCLFSRHLCDSETETCYNDLAFGKCIPQYGDLTEEDLYQYEFNPEQLDLLRLQLERLELEGYKWKHPYTQCIMETSLYNIRHGQIYDLRLCQHLKEYNRHSHENTIDQDVRVPAIAIVKFTPNNGNVATDFANELYYPPGTQNRYVRRSFFDNEIQQLPYAEPTGESIDRLYRPRYPTYNEYDSLTNNENVGDLDHLPSRQSPLNVDDYDDRLYRIRRQPYNLRDYDDNAIQSIKNALEKEKLARRMLEVDDVSTERESLLNDNLDFMIDDASPVDYPLQEEETQAEADLEDEKSFSRKYKHQRQFSNPEDLATGELWLDNVKKNLKENTESLEYENLEDNNENNAKDDESMTEDKIYAEGGLVEPVNVKSNDADENVYGPLLDDDFDILQWRRELAGFKRRERLDVKKPGPLFSTNNYAFKTQTVPPSEKEDNAEGGENNEVLLAPYVKKEKFSNGYELDTGLNNYNNVDLDHVYVEFEQPFYVWADGEDVVEEIGHQLGLKEGSLRDIRVGRAEVTFKVVPNNKNYNATDVVKNIVNIRENLEKALGVEVIRAGIGDKAKLPAMFELIKKSEISSNLFGAAVAAGLTAAGAAAAVTLIIARRHAKSRAKLAGLATPDPEASKDYQDLCRARMQAKQPTEKPESPRITSLSRENDSNNTRSNRSSTSSWGDEAALASMDTSTGHVVLSYMEDHLKNKDRLDKEWAALCAYEADSFSVENGEMEENVNRNRPGAPLPYDHSRLVLNHLANADDSDYINASTITDHDPRNPAYIATQGPLPQTTADFWQMVWEQGSVVIVMLTRLTEEGVAMCHRYWPEQEFEQYNIYEVHLLSEYPGCDDYLVRSFYLKNLETGETRTVTQFHFLSWPENRVPQSTKALLEFRRKVNKSYRGRSCPIVVHCSDGAGRTGTYCLIDMVLNRMMKGAKEIDIAATLEHIRDQRGSMVATKQQFEFVFVAVAEEVRAILKALPVASAEKTPPAASSSSSTSQQATN